MTKYWVSLGLPELILEQDEKDIAFKVAILELANCEDEAGFWYKSEDLDEVRKVYQQVIDIDDKLFGKGAEGDAEASLKSLGILPIAVTQPECPNCGFLEQFSANYCRHCGTELIPSREIELKGGSK